MLGRFRSRLGKTFVNRNVKRSFAEESRNSYLPPPPPPTDSWRIKVSLAICATYVLGLAYVFTLPKDWDWNTGKSVDGKEELTPIPVPRPENN